MKIKRTSLTSMGRTRKDMIKPFEHVLGNGGHHHKKFKMEGRGLMD
jgi:hypothetical protein